MAQGLLVGFKAFLGPTTGGLPAPSPGHRSWLRCAPSAPWLCACRSTPRTPRKLPWRPRRRGPDALGLVLDASVHPDSRPVEAEVVAIDHIGALAAETGCPVHIVHLSSRDGLEAIERWRSRCLDISSEVSPNHLFLVPRTWPRSWTPDEDEPTGAVAIRGTRRRAPRRAGRRTAGHGRVCPRTAHARREAGCRRLVGSLGRGRRRDERGRAAVACRCHRPFDPRAVHRGDIVALARVWGLRGKGRIEVGADADITCLDLEREAIVDEARLHGRSSLSPFRGERPARSAGGDHRRGHDRHARGDPGRQSLIAGE